MGNVDYAPARRDRVQIAQQAHATVVTMPVSAAAQLQQPAQHRLPFPPSDLNYFSAHSARSTSLRSGCCCACDIHRRGRLRGRCGAAPRGRAAGVGCPRLAIHNCACCWRGALQQRRSPTPRQPPPALAARPLRLPQAVNPSAFRFHRRCCSTPVARRRATARYACRAPTNRPCSTPAVRRAPQTGLASRGASLSGAHRTTLPLVAPSRTRRVVRRRVPRE